MFVQRKQAWLDKNYDIIRSIYIDELIENGDYPRHIAEETNDWRDEFVDKEYGQYVLNEIEKQAIINKAHKRDWERHVHINWSDNPLYI